MWKHRNRMTEDEDDFYADDIVPDEEEPERRFFWQKMFGGKHREAEDDIIDDAIDTDDEYNDAPVRRKVSGKRTLIVGLAVAAAAAGILCVSRWFPSDAYTVHRALVNSSAALSTYVDDSSPLIAAAEQMKMMLDRGSFAMDLTVDKPNGAIALSMDYSQREKLMSGVLNWSSTRNPAGVDISFSANKKEMRLSAPALVKDRYGFRLADFGKGRDNLSQLLENTPIDINLPDNKLDFFAPLNLDKLMKDRAGESWIAFKRTVKIKKFDSRDIQLGDKSRYCTVYQVTWDPAAADQLGRELSGAMTAVPVGLLTLLPDVEPDCRLFVDENNCVIGGDCSIPGKKYTVLMTGEGSAWGEISVEILSATEGARYLTGGLEITEKCLALRLSDEASEFFCADYDNATGVFRVTTPGATLLEGSLLMMDSTVKLSLGSSEAPTISLGMTPLSTRPVVDDGKYVDILNMSLNEWNRVVMEIKNSLFD